MVISHEVLPAGCLLALASAARPAPLAETELATHLARASTCGRPTVWVDCRLLDELSHTAAWLLWACQQALARRRGRLVLNQASAAVRRVLSATLPDAGAGLLFADSLDEAARLAPSVKGSAQP